MSSGRDSTWSSHVPLHGILCPLSVVSYLLDVVYMAAVYIYIPLDYPNDCRSFRENPTEFARNKCIRRNVTIKSHGSDTFTSFSIQLPFMGLVHPCFNELVDTKQHLIQQFSLAQKSNDKQSCPITFELKLFIYYVNYFASSIFFNYCYHVDNITFKYMLEVKKLCNLQ